MPERSRAQRVGPAGPFGSPRAAGARALGLGALVALALAPAARGAELFVDPSVSLRETATSNANFGILGTTQSDFVSELDPAVVMRALGRRFSLDGNLSLDAIDYRRHALPDRILPDGGVDGQIEAVEDHGYIDAVVHAAPSYVSLFGPQSQSAPTLNTFTTVNYRLSPYWKGRLEGGELVVVRLDDGWVRGMGGGTQSSAVDSNLGRASADVDSLPRPLGWNAHVETERTRYVDETIPATHESLGRLTVKYRLTDVWMGALRAGVEDESFLADHHARPVEGAGISWRPSERTDGELTVDHRYFGPAWNFRLKHTVARLGIEWVGGREVLTSAESVFALPATGHEVAAMLDAMLQATTPDPVARAAAVRDLLAQEALPAEYAAANQIFSSAPVQVTSNRLVLTWLAQRDAVNFSTYVLRTQLPGGLAPQFVDLRFSGEALQRGVLLSATHRLGPLTSLGLDGQINKVDGFGFSVGSRSRQNNATLRLARYLGPRTQVTGGLRLQTFESNVIPSTREKAAFVGVSHHF